MASGIYIIVNTENHKIYVGSTNRLNKRKNQHWYLLRNNKHPNKHLQFAWNKYREYCFEFRVIELCPENKLVEREDHWMKHYNSIDNKFGYNIETANRIKFSEEHRKNMSIAIKNAYANKVWTEEEKETCRNRMLGRKLSKETKDKMSVSRKEFLCLNTDAIKSANLCSIAKTSRQIKRSDGKIFKSISEASRELGKHSTLIARCCKNNGTAYGYKWSYV
jgi:group I intron endonuclease